MSCGEDEYRPWKLLLLYIADYNAEDGQRVADELDTKYSISYKFISTDVAREADIQTAV